MERKRPGQLMAISVIALILGPLGMCAGCMGAFSPLIQEAQTDMLRSLPETPGANIEAQVRLQERIQAAVAPYMPFSIAHQCVNLFFSLLLFVAGVLILRWHEKALRIFTVAAIGSLLVDFVGAAYGISSRKRRAKRSSPR